LAGLHRLDRTSVRLAHLFDHLVGACEQGGWHVKAKCLRGRQIDDEIEQAYPPFAPASRAATPQRRQEA
jgi:hypothetical protein